MNTLGHALVVAAVLILPDAAGAESRQLFNGTDLTGWKHVGVGSWEVQGGGPLDVTGRLIGGCTETIAHLAGTPYGDVRGWAEALDGPTIVYVEACE